MFVSIESTDLSIKARLFRGFSDPSRLKILEVLRTGEHTVGAIVEQTGLSQSNVSNHLGCLRDCGLVTAEQRGKFVGYYLSDPRVDELLSLAETLLADVAQGVYQCTRYETRGNRDG
jgi:DNA-binding transcriptional ArsR family regulator